MSIKSVLSGRWTRLLVSTALVALLLYITDSALILDTLTKAEPFWLILALIVATSLTAFGAFKWWILMPRSRRGVLTFIRINFVSNFVGIFFPGIVGIEAARIAGAARSSQDLPAAISSVIVDRVFGLLTLGTMASLGGIFAHQLVPESVTLTCLTLLFGMGISIFLIMNNTVRLGLSHLLPSFINKQLLKLFECFDLYRNRYETLILSFFLSLTFQFLRVIMVWLLAHSLSIDVEFQFLMIVVPVALFVQMLPISVYGLGIRESAMISLLALANIGPESAFALSILLLAVQIAGALPGGLLLTMGFRLEAAPRSLNEGHKM